MKYSLAEDHLVDYSPVTSRIEQKGVEYLFRALLKNDAIRLDFDENRSVNIGSDDPEFAIAPPRLHTMLKALVNPRYLFCEYFTQGHWHCTQGDLAALALSWQEQIDGQHLSRFRPFHEISTWLRFFIKQFLMPTMATRQTKDHYNVSAEFFENVIGPSMVYSCAFFTNGESLEEAQTNKFNTILERSDIKRQDALDILDIGCGWGSLAFHIVKESDSRVDGISIASNQINYARNRTEYLTDDQAARVNFIDVDYLDFRKKEQHVYDRIVSVGMIEHVGKTQYPKFFNEVKRLLKKDGTALIHSLICLQGGAPNVWVDKYIFPGGYIPRASEVIHGAEEAGLKCHAVYRHDGENYAHTLEHWRDNLITNEEECAAEIVRLIKERNAKQNRYMTTDQIEQEKRKTMRVWLFYLSALQSIFRRSQDQCCVSQFVFGR